MIPIGTRSVLYGAHAFWLHPWFVAAAWRELYGFPREIPIYVAFFVHDLGYWGKDNLDGPEGETHPEWGARLMERWFGPEWGDFVRYHSRFLARRDNRPFSRLCVADKLALAITPRWLYLPLITLTGEINEYLKAREPGGKYATERRFADPGEDWIAEMQTFCRRWVAEHKDLRPDTWTGQLR